MTPGPLYHGPPVHCEGCGNLYTPERQNSRACSTSCAAKLRWDERAEEAIEAQREESVGEALRPKPCRCDQPLVDLNEPEDERSCIRCGRVPSEVAA